jgi:hypothetical protein
MSCFVDIVLWIFFFLTRLYYESDCYICMKNAVPKGVECRNYTKIEQCQLCLATIPLVCLLVFSCKSNSNLAAWGYGYICTLNVGGRSEIMVHLNTALGCTQLSGFRAQFGTWDNLFLIMYQLKSWPSFVVWFRITCCLRRKGNLKTSLGVGRVVFICLFPPINEMMCSSPVYSRKKNNILQTIICAICILFLLQHITMLFWAHLCSHFKILPWILHAGPSFVICFSA